jgi:hypothetical protein
LYLFFTWFRNQKITASRVITHKQITSFLMTSPAIGPTTPVPPSTSNTTSQPTPPEAQPTPNTVAETQVEVIPVSSGRKDGSCSATKRDTPEEAQDKGQEEAEVNSADKAEAMAHDAIIFSAKFCDPSDHYATSKAYSTKFFNKLTEAEKWELEQDLLKSMLNNAWGKADAECSDIQNHERETCEFFDQLLCKHKVNKSSQ